jgi:hyperosmotically inducible protein
MRRAEIGSAWSTGRSALSAAVTVLAVSTLAAAHPAAASDAKGSLKSRVEERLSGARLEEQGDIAVVERDGGVVLEGAVLTLDDQRRAGTLARKETKKVENHLRVGAEPVSNDLLRHAVAQAILGYPRYEVFDSVDLAVSDGAVLLKGAVLHPYRKTEIEARVARVEGVKAIRNEIRVQPVSAFDDRLRAQLFRAIYGDQRFVQYRHWADPPIRIVVENGHVTLTGYVSTAVERTLLDHIARSSASFGVVNRVQVEGDAAKEADRKDS